MWCVSGVAPRRRALLFLFLLSLTTMMTMMLFLLMLLRVRKPCNHLLHVFSLHLHLHLALLLESIISSSRVEEQLRHILCTFFLARRGVFCQKFLLLFLQMLFTLPRYPLSFFCFFFFRKRRGYEKTISLCSSSSSSSSFSPFERCTRPSIKSSNVNDEGFVVFVSVVAFIIVAFSFVRSFVRCDCSFARARFRERERASASLNRKTSQKRVQSLGNGISRGKQNTNFLKTNKVSLSTFRRFLSERSPPKALARDVAENVCRAFFFSRSIRDDNTPPPPKKKKGF